MIKNEMKCYRRSTRDNGVRGIRTFLIGVNVSNARLLMMLLLIVHVNAFQNSDNNVPLRLQKRIVSMENNNMPSAQHSTVNILNQQIRRNKSITIHNNYQYNKNSVGPIMAVADNDCDPKKESTLTNSVLQKLSLLRHVAMALIVVVGSLFLVIPNDNTNSYGMMANAAPPFAVIAEELGYFPIQNPTTGDLIYVPQRIKRHSTEQAIQLATLLNTKGVVLAGTYWCPHTTRQKELFGQEAFYSNIRYVECSSKGFNGQPAICLAQKVTGYPTWLFPDGTQISGERSLSYLAQSVGMTTFQDELEDNTPSLLGADSCK